MAKYLDQHRYFIDRNTGKLRYDFVKKYQVSKEGITVLFAFDLPDRMEKRETWYKWEDTFKTPTSLVKGLVENFNKNHDYQMEINDNFKITIIDSYP